jgi:SAM-dependent methyltransferase
MINAVPDYTNLDLSGEVQQAANRMEARAREPASQEMFQELIAPLLTPEVKTILEFGCGTAALSRKIARTAGQALVYASDKSEGMLKVARQLVEDEGITHIHLQLWDALDESSFPFSLDRFDLIISSVVIPYFDEAQTIALIGRLANRLRPGGILAFMEQDLTTDTVNSPMVELLHGALTRHMRQYRRTLALGLRPILREAGLQLLPRRSFLWTDNVYGDYSRDLLERLADAACERGEIAPEERDRWNNELEDRARSGDFYYGIVYHLVAARRAASP